MNDKQFSLIFRMLWLIAHALISEEAKVNQTKDVWRIAQEFVEYMEESEKGAGI